MEDKILNELKKLQSLPHGLKCYYDDAKLIPFKKDREYFLRCPDCGYISNVSSDLLKILGKSNG